MTAAYLGSKKVQHVLRAGQTRNHECHWPGCGKQVPPAMWGCRKHWYDLPIDIRNAIWKTYRIGQERDGSPSREYLAAADAAQRWIAANYPGTRQRPPEQGALL